MLVLLFVALWFILRCDLFYVLPCVICSCVFQSVSHTHDRIFFFLQTFHFWKWGFANAVTSIADVCHVVMTIQWRLVTSLCSLMANRDVLYNHRTSNTSKFSIFIFPTGWIRVFEIRFAGTGVICGNPYSLCKKHVFNCTYCIKSSVALINSRALTGEKPCINKAIHALLIHGYATFNMIVPGPQICCRYEMCTARL